MSSDVWHSVVHDLALITKVCVYDRAGLGFSDRPPFQNYSYDSEDSKASGIDRWQVSTVERMADDLHKLITYSSQQPRPLLLVGAEIGALVAQFYAQIYEGDVTDVVLVNPLAENLFSSQQQVWTHYWFNRLLPSLQATQLAAATGFSRLALLFGLWKPPMSEAAEELHVDIVRRQKHLLCNPRHMSSAVDEHFFINQSMSQLKTVFMMKQFASNISISVISGSNYDNQLSSSINTVWSGSVRALVKKLHPVAHHSTTKGADRHILYQHPDAVVQPVRKLVEAWRTKQNLA
jgi:pimeloyl-ACP methyl ester carboxylesterase